MSSALTLLSSMAVKRLLADLMAMYRHTHADAAIELTSIGGVDAARRVAAGEPFDAVVLAADALEAIRARLISVPRGGRAADAVSVCYPLVVNNLVARALNTAAAAGWDSVTAEVIAEC